MLIEFTLGNHRSFREIQTLSLVASRPGEDDPRVRQISKKLSVLHSVAVYGANGSGKSNLFHALRTMRQVVLDSAREGQAGDPLPMEPFLLHDDYADDVSSFEVVFLADGDRFRYGFEATTERVESEWLYWVAEGKRQESHLFTREQQDIKLGPGFRREGRGLDERTRTNALFLSVCSQFGGHLATRILEWFQRLVPLSGLSDTHLMGVTIDLLEQGGSSAEAIQALLRGLDLGFTSLRVTPPDLKELARFQDVLREIGLPKEVRPPTTSFRRIKTAHTVYPTDPERHRPPRELDLHQHESAGTERLVALAGPLIDALRSNLILIIDEFDARLHPVLSHKLVELFHRQLGPEGTAQLIIFTHDSHLLGRDLLRRDQVWFVEKTPEGASDLYSLAELKVRKDADYQKNYLAGRYGAIPFLGGLDSLELTP